MLAHGDYANLGPSRAINFSVNLKVEQALNMYIQAQLIQLSQF